MSRTILTTLTALLVGLAVPAGPAHAQGQNMREEMRKRMEEISRLMRESEKLLLEITVANQLNRLFDGQKQRGEGAAHQLMELLKNWPKNRQQGQSQPDQDKKKQKKSKPKPEKDKHKELKNRDKPQSPRDKKELFKKKPERGKRPQDKKQAARQGRRIDAWIASLPPEQLERINRGDLGFIPARYRRLLREYTAKRAKREAEESTDDR